MVRLTENASDSGNGRKSILVVEDDRAMRDLLCDALSTAGYEAFAASNRNEMSLLVRTRHIDLITLDLTLGAEDGLEVAGEIRKTANVPIIIISGRGEPIDRVAGLEQGADDYIVKPFHVKEVIIRINSVLERYSRLTVKPSEHRSKSLLKDLRFDHHVLDSKQRLLLHADGMSISLTETEFEILAMFLENPGRILSRDEIWFVLRGHERDPMDRTLDGHIAHLRKKIDESGCRALHINSVRGIGYVFVSDLEADSAS